MTQDNPETQGTERQQQQPSSPSNGSEHPLVRRPRHKWFAAHDPKTDGGWWGPHDTIEAAAMDALCNNGSDRIFVAQGHKLPKDERYYPEWDWEVDAARAFEIVLPNDKAEAQPPGNAAKIHPNTL